MKGKGWKVVIMLTIVLVILAVINTKYQFIIVPSSSEMVQRQIDYVTISTVFAGFSFTALGLLLGLSSEKLIERIKNTTIIMKKVNRVVMSIVFFILSVSISLVFILGIDQIISIGENRQIYLSYGLYFLSIGYLIAGICYFVYSVKELFDLIKRIYDYNTSKSNHVIDDAKKQMVINKQKELEFLQQETEKLDN
ncbi:MAG: hypothetical protein SOY03_06330 [Bariatricus sp.]|nr:hypothetical protein [Bariatricus sp.]